MLTENLQSGIFELYPKRLQTEEGGKTMNYELLRSYIKDSGLKISFLADKIGITRQSLNAKINGRRSFSQSEIMALKQALRLDDDTFMRIFFTECVPETATREQS